MNQINANFPWYTFTSRIVAISCLISLLQACTSRLDVIDTPIANQPTGTEFPEGPVTGIVTGGPTLMGNISESILIPLQGSLVYTDYLGVYIFDFSKKEFRVLDYGNGTYYEGVSVANDVIYYLLAGGVTNTNDIYSISFDGSFRERWTDDDYNDFHINIAPNGRYLAFETYWEAPHNLYKLFILDVNTRERWLITENASNQYGSIFWSPDSKNLVFFENTRQEGFSDRIFLFDFEKMELKELTSIGQVTQLAWSPDGRSILLGRSDGIESGIYLLNVNTDQINKIAVVSGSPRRFNWSPDGSMILFELLKIDERSVQLQLLNVKDGKITTIQEGKLEGAHFSYQSLWSPDNKYIAYFIDLDSDNWRLRLQDIETSQSWEYKLPHNFPNAAVWINSAR